MREENCRLDERLKNTSKRVAALESDLDGTRQQLRMREDEKHAQHAMLEKASSEAARLSRKQTINDLSAALRRVQMERSVVEGTLETARKDFSRVMRELMALQRRQSAEEPALQPQAVSAA